MPTVAARPNVKAFPLSQHLVLIGMMGAGKTTVGRRLAKYLSVPFVDADDAINEAAGMEISEIFEILGEDAFREGERKVILRLLEKKPCVIATGGGAFLNEETRDAIMANSVSVWLDADLDTLVQRTSRNRARPLLNGVDRVAKLRELKMARDPIYCRALIKIDTNNKTWASLIDAILTSCRPYMTETNT